MQELFDLLVEFLVFEIVIVVGDVEILVAELCWTKGRSVAFDLAVSINPLLAQPRHYLGSTEVASKVGTVNSSHANRVNSSNFPFGLNLQLLFSKPGGQSLNAQIRLLELRFIVIVLAFEYFELLLRIVLLFFHMCGKLVYSPLHIRLVVFPSLQLLLVFNLELLHF